MILLTDSSRAHLSPYRRTPHHRAQCITALPTPPRPGRPQIHHHSQFEILPDWRVPAPARGVTAAQTRHGKKLACNRGAPRVDSATTIRPAAIPAGKCIVDLATTSAVA